MRSRRCSPSTPRRRVCLDRRAFGVIDGRAITPGMNGLYADRRIAAVCRLRKKRASSSRWKLTAAAAAGGIALHRCLVADDHRRDGRAGEGDVHARFVSHRRSLDGSVMTMIGRSRPLKRRNVSAIVHVGASAASASASRWRPSCRARPPCSCRVRPARARRCPRLVRRPCAGRGAVFDAGREARPRARRRGAPPRGSDASAAERRRRMRARTTQARPGFGAAASA